MSEIVPAPLNFLGLSPEYSDPERSRFFLLPMPYEAENSSRRGTRFGPDAILRVSQRLDRFDEAHRSEPWKEGIATLPPVDVCGPAVDVFRRAAETVEPLLRRNRFVLTLGGERSLTEGPLSAAVKVHPGLAVLQLDAHAGLRGEPTGAQYRHDDATGRMMEYASVVQVGVRSIPGEGGSFRSAGRVTTFLMQEHRSVSSLIAKVLRVLGDPVYLSIDLDALDPSILPAVGAPVPGGLGWYDVLDLLRAVVRARTVVAADVTELSPLPDEIVSDVTAAKLAYRLIGTVAAKTPPGAGSRRASKRRKPA